MTFEVSIFHFLFCRVGLEDESDTFNEDVSLFFILPSFNASPIVCCLRGWAGGGGAENEANFYPLTE